jgi:hypothetical protein
MRALADAIEQRRAVRIKITKAPSDVLLLARTLVSIDYLPIRSSTETVLKLNELVGLHDVGAHSRSGLSTPV